MKKDNEKEFLWIDKNNKIISCEETNKILNENFIEVTSVLQNAFDDAILIGCNEDDFKKKFIKLMNSLEFSIGKE
tara:strand:- start:389 stop:613 length:225 start_codon:yes stop_codon:yes gene_type:complete